MDVHDLLLRAWVRLESRRGDERGDVPGWVMITLMTAALVSLIWAIAGDRLGEMLNRAFDSVH